MIFQSRYGQGYGKGRLLCWSPALTSSRRDRRSRVRRPWNHKGISFPLSGGDRELDWRRPIHPITAPRCGLIGFWYYIVVRRTILLTRCGRSDDACGPIIGAQGRSDQRPKERRGVQWRGPKRGYGPRISFPLGTEAKVARQWNIRRRANATEHLNGGVRRRHFLPGSLTPRW